MIKLPLDPPRDYPLKATYQGRVWRSASGAICREIRLLSTLLAVAGFLYARPAWVLLGALGVILAALALQLMTLQAHLLYADVIRRGARVEGWVEQPRRVFLLHELLRGEAGRTFILPYAWQTRGGATRAGRLWICGCARAAFPQRTPIEILTLNTRSLPLKAATLRIKRA
ncbi:hypothetical protein KKF91_11790 [Myxococcota bacterium]|nr:hypothetical protein [Myxococcota bacterium]MBU1431211.1 hypothetical protein [Myxococcota bacterium]MBU1896798.1 hypothetical protein [Myxococcota bacterium]